MEATTFEWPVILGAITGLVILLLGAYGIAGAISGED